MNETNTQNIAGDNAEKETVQLPKNNGAGKGDKARNISNKFRDNFDEIAWSYKDKIKDRYE